MAKFDAEIRGFDRLMKKLEGVSTEDILPAVNKATLFVEGQAKELAPVASEFSRAIGAISGQLRESIHTRVETEGEKITGTVFTATEYAPYVEFGTGVKGNGTYPYQPEGITLSYKDKGWSFPNPMHPEEFIHTKGQKAQPFMYPALHQNRKKVDQILQDGIKQAIREKMGGSQ